MRKFYITTTLPYVNAEPHIGFAMEIIMADVLARWHRQLGDEVFFNTGTDEHGLKVYRKAQELGVDVQKYCDEQAQNYKNLRELLNLSWDNFIRTTDERHIKAAQEFWRRCDSNGYITKKKYKIKYCVGCELEKTESELVNGRCPLHPDTPLEIIDEENYFFEFSKFSKKLLDLYEINPKFVIPGKKLNEIKQFVKMGLEDFSISRLKTKMPWGIGVPGDSKHVMYVWFDALVNYIVAIGWPDDLEEFNFWWPVTQIAGKDNLRQQAAMWQAMLMAAGLPNSKQIFIGGFITVGGQKMSKTLGNVIDPEQMLEKFGVDGTRYLLLTLGSFGEDVDVTLERLSEKYNADLANGLGNLLSRVFNLIEMNFEGELKEAGGVNLDIGDLMKDLKFFEALQRVKEKIDWGNKYIDETKLWELVKADKPKAKKVLAELLGVIIKAGESLAPFMPETSQKILKASRAKKITKGEALFPRL
jgi:methionyl-tRNA synthetase